MTDDLTHLDERGNARMVDVGGKVVTQRRAVARAVVRMAPSTARLLVDGGLPKGDALAVARVAGIMAAKRTPDLIPLCHPNALTSVEVDIAVAAQEGAAEITVTAQTAERTGVEMEALVAASVAALTIYDMAKAIDTAMVLGEVRLVQKTKEPV